MLGSCARTFAGSDLLTVAPALFVALPMQRQQVLSLSITTSFWEPWLRMPTLLQGLQVQSGAASLVITAGQFVPISLKFGVRIS